MPEAGATQTAAMTEHEGVKDTLESIVVALILAFVFRAFIIEAFVIPTGSMAPTLYGAHGTIVCEDCGVEFAYGLKDLADPRRIEPVRARDQAVCPNCNHANTDLSINDDRRNREKGDRILVLKWPFDIGGDRLGPSRWDVIVFKDPADGVTNFIKRLAGLPNEVLRIIDGDVYSVPLEKLSDRARTVLDAIRHEKYELRTEQRRGSLSRVPPDVLDELDEQMVIARKTPAAQKSLWFRVYDHDFPPRTRGPNQPRWRPARESASGWDASNRCVRFSDRGVAPDYIELFNKRIDAGCAYNVRGSDGPEVADLRVAFVLTPQTSDGTLWVRLEKRSRVFWARIGIDGSVSLVESPDLPEPSARTMVERKLPAFVPGRSLRISFENVDYRLALWVGGKEVLSSSDDPDAPAYYAPDIGSLRRGRPDAATPPRLYGAGGAFDVTHLVVERDAYYFHDSRYRALALPWAPEVGWASPETPILLRGHEYFMLGDNTSASKDSRLWDEVGPHLENRGEAFQLGTVPRDQLIGKAFFVYWPSGHPLRWLPRIGDWNWAIVPDVGRMRWIR